MPVSEDDLLALLHPDNCLHGSLNVWFLSALRPGRLFYRIIPLPRAGDPCPKHLSLCPSLQLKRHHVTQLFRAKESLGETQVLSLPLPQEAW